MEITKFDTSNCLPQTKLLYENWATIPVARIYNILLSSKKKEIYSMRSISKMADVSLGSVHKSLKLLVENNYIIKKNDKYLLNLSVHFGEQSVHCDEQSVHCGEQTVHSRERSVHSREQKGVHFGEHTNNNNIYNKNNNKNNNNNTKKRKIEFLEFDNYPDIKITKKEFLKIKEKYKSKNANLDFGLDKLQSYAEIFPNKFKKYKSHYRVLIGWVLDETIKRQPEISLIQKINNKIEQKNKTIELSNFM